jgi:hypothetical protein
MGLLHKNGKNAQRKFRHYTEPWNRGAAKAPATTTTADPMNYTIAPIGFSPNAIPSPMPAPGYVLWQCIGSSWQRVGSEPDYDTLYGRIPAGGILADCSECCAGGVGGQAVYYTICPEGNPPCHPLAREAKYVHPAPDCPPCLPCPPCPPAKRHGLFRRLCG